MPPEASEPPVIIGDPHDALNADGHMDGGHMDAAPSHPADGMTEDQHHGVQGSPAPSGQAMPGHDSPGPSPSGTGHGHGDSDGHDNNSAAEGGHGGDEPPAGETHGDDGHWDDGHGDEAPQERPREAVFGGFFALNGLALAGAAFLRRRDSRDAARRAAEKAAKAAEAAARRTDSMKDASR